VASSSQIFEGLFASGPPLRTHQLLGLARRGSVRRAVTSALVSWVPIFVLTTLGSALGWGSGLGSFAPDIAFHTRCLVVVPLLILGETPCSARLSSVVQRFKVNGLVPEEEYPRFDRAITSTLRLRDARLAEILVILLAFATTFAVAGVVTESTAWRYPGNGPLPLLSPAAWWETLVSLPLLLALIFGWFWRILLWTRFLWCTSQLKLSLVLTHPDLTGGLGFVGSSARAFFPLACAFGLIVAGAAADAVLIQGHSIYSFRSSVLVTLAFVLVISCAPPLVFFWVLLSGQRSASTRYGAIATAVGRELEGKWLDGRRIDATVLGAQDFSTTIDLYEVVARVYQVKLFPFDLRGLGFLVVGTLAPFVPLVVVALPFDVIVAKLKGFLL
jgi:hypothetical protein